MATKGLDYVINIKDGDFSGASKAKSDVQGLDTEVANVHEHMGSLGEMIGHVGVMIGEAFAAEKMIEFGKESLNVYRETESAAAQVAAGIKSTAGVAGESLDELREKAEALEHKTLFTEAQTLNADAMLLTFTNIRGKVFDEAIPAIEDLATRMGGDGPADLKGASIQVGKALQDPITGIAALHRVGVSFNDLQKKQIETMVKHGDVAGADALILKELNNEFGGSAAAARGVLGPSADLNVEIEEMEKKFGSLINDGLRVVVPLLLDVMHGVEDVGGSLQGAYNWVKDNADIFKSLGIAVGGVGLAYVVTNAELIISNTQLGLGAIAAEGMALWTGVLTAAQWALNVAMDANPIGLIITGIGLLAAGVYYAYEKSETFRAVLGGIGEVASELVPVFKGLGEIILGALTVNPALVIAGFKDAYDGVQKVIADGGIGGAFNKGFDASMAESAKADAEQKKKDADLSKGTGSASGLVKTGPTPDSPYSITTGGKGGHHGHSRGEGASLTGGRQVRNVTVTIGKLVEKLEVHTTNLSGLSTSDIKRQLTELLTEAVHDSELALGSQ